MPSGGRILHSKSKHDNLMQDALETNWSTARHAYFVVLQDVERRRSTKVRISNTARVIMPKNMNQSSKPGKPNTKDKVCADYNQNNCSHQSDHMVDG